jgi:hypothetical protein
VLRKRGSGIWDEKDVVLLLAEWKVREVMRGISAARTSGDKLDAQAFGTKDYPSTPATGQYPVAYR